MYRITKVLNHNTVLAVKDKSASEYLIVGKGVGFGKKITQSIEPTDEDSLYELTQTRDRGPAKDIVKSIEPEYLEIANTLLDDAEHEFGHIDRSILFPMADHIAFAVKRMENKEQISNPLNDDIRVMFYKEYKIAENIRHILKDKKQIDIIDDEIGYITLHIHTSLNNSKVSDAMEMAAALDVPISLHEEDPELIVSPGVNQGKVSEKLHYGGAPARSEYEMVRRDCELALQTRARTVIQHISSAEAVEAVRQCWKKGGRIYGEVTPQHFSATEDLVLEKGSLARVNPPLRTEADRQAIIEGLKDGTLNIIATDHAPHSREEKAKDLKDAPSGMIGLETSLALGITNLVKTGELELMGLLEKMTINPAMLYHLNAGRLTEGGPADLVLFDPEKKWVVEEQFYSKASNSPFIGMELTGQVQYTICGGKVIFER